MYKRNNILHNLNWITRMSKDRKYLIPRNIWEKFLYAMSYNRGSLLLEAKSQEKAAVVVNYVELITQATTKSIPEMPVSIPRYSNAHTQSATTKITILTPELIR
jgi:hypothetical protein